jgi:hypothetical protein
MCRQGCRTQDHDSWGECLRAAEVRTYHVAVSKGFDATAQKKWDRELEGFRQASAEGIRPDGTKWSKIDKARRLSDKVGAAYGRDFNQATPMES